MKRFLFISAIAAIALAVPVFGNSRIKIDTVPSEYAPPNSPTNREPVSMSSYYFEVNDETGRARLVVEYTYPDQMTYGPDDDSGGPRPTVVQLPGLAYDKAARSVVYDSNGTKAVCATVNGTENIFGHRLKVKNTGACTVTVTVTTLVANRSEDSGWDIHRFRALDTYFEVH